MAGVELQKDFCLEKYLGLWYEIAKYPQFFGKGCSFSTAEYTLNCDHTIKVDNKCYDSCGKCIWEVVGTAFSWNQTYPTALRVDFPGFSDIPELQKEQYQPNYLIHNTNYHYSIVGSPDKTGLYILSRRRRISRAFFDLILAYVEKLGYDKNKIIINEGSLK